MNRTFVYNKKSLLAIFYKYGFGLFCVLLFVFCAIFISSFRKSLLMFSNDKILETNINSSCFKTVEERVKYLKDTSVFEFVTPIEDTSYIINYASTYFVGPSIAKFRIAIKIKPQEINHFFIYNNTYKKTLNSIEYDDDIKSLIIPWKHNSIPVFYCSEIGNYCIVFQKEGIIIGIINQ